jgi:programmed cell death 6-interacting protein
VSVGLITALMSLKDAIDRDLQKHSRENEVVYMVRVPAYEDLPELGAAAMVKPAAPAPESLDAAGETLFSNIVPESGFTALSKYTELVDATIREETDVLALASDEARAALAEMELPELLIAAEAGAASAVPGGAGDAGAGAGAGLPAPLAEEVAAAQRAGVSAGFRGDVARLREAHDACAHRVDATERALDAEATEDEACRGAYGGDKWTRPPSAALSRNLREKVAAYRQNLAQAFRSDESLRARVADASEGVLRLLEPESMAAATPALRAPMVSTSDGDVLAELRAATSDLEAIGAERAGIEATAKAIKERDNIMAKVMAAENPGAHEALFERELEKYDEVKAAVASNVSSQADVLGRLRREREAFARAYDVDGWRAASAIHAEATRDALAHYRELASGIERGTTFYAGFAAATAQLLEEAEAWVESRRREKAQLEAAVAQRAQAAAEVAQNHAAAAAAAHRAAADQAAAGRAMAEAHARQATAATHAMYDPYAPPTHALAPPPGVGGAHGYPPAPTSPPAPTRVEYPPQPQQASAPFAPPPPPGSHLYPPNPYGQQPPPPPHGYR